jgi:hypothetical protein
VSIFETYKALERAEKVKKRAEKLENITLNEGLPRVAEIVGEVFGKDYRVSKTPFGIKFSERVHTFKPGTTDLTPTATATGTIGGSFFGRSMEMRMKLDVDG